MFFLMPNLKYNLKVHPQHLGPKLFEHINKMLEQEVEGVALGKLGFVITVAEVNWGNISMGKIDETSGFVSFTVEYQAIVFRPFKNEVLDAIVTKATPLGFFCEVGPLQVFVSRHQLPSDMEDGFEADTQTWFSEDKDVEIKAQSGVRLRIMGINIDASTIEAIGTIKDDYLGLIESAAR